MLYLHNRLDQSKISNTQNVLNISNTYNSKEGKCVQSLYLVNVYCCINKPGSN